MTKKQFTLSIAIVLAIAGLTFATLQLGKGPDDASPDTPFQTGEQFRSNDVHILMCRNGACEDVTAVVASTLQNCGLESLSPGRARD